MKRIILLIIFYVSIINNAYTQDQVMGVFPCGIGMSFSNNSEYYLDIDINLLYYSYEFDAGLGITWIPVNYKYISNNHYWSLINFKIYWNIFSYWFLNSNFEKYSNMPIFGPFYSINYGPNFNFSNYIQSYGLKFTYTQYYHGKLYLLSLECGSRIIDQRNNFYFNVSVDILLTSIVLHEIFTTKWRR